ncbi:MAG: hypothetical protein ACOY3Z_05845 [Thermodesulfobacteriota bacterium]
MQVVCCVCQKTKQPNGWKKIAPAPGEEVSHGYCPQCYGEFMRQVRRFFSASEGCKAA